MKRRPRRRLALAFTLAIVAFVVLLLGSWFHDAVMRRRPASAGLVGTSGSRDAPRPDAPAPAAAGGEVAELRSRDLRMPIDGTDVQRWKGSFQETHFGHKHEAVDILAPRDTPIHAVSDGRISKLFLSKAGGLTAYELDPSQRYIYYYAHLDHYAPGLHEGDAVSRGQVIGYVGTSGDAPPDTPHLHFTIFRVQDPKRWWEGTAIDPYEVFRRR